MGWVLEHYALLNSVLLWIAPWWGLAALLWEDIRTRVQRLVEGVTGSTPTRVPA
ncbi:MAG: hypothetical protein IPI67_06570 [Myxococcales bacterium]|nr:hypothetical protein [Myxococcales bacterium]